MNGRRFGDISGKRLPRLRWDRQISCRCARTTRGSFIPIPAQQQLLLERESAPIPDALAIEQRDVTSNNAAFHSMQRHRISQLQLDARTGQQAPIRFDERAAGRNVDNLRRSAGAKPAVRHPDVVQRRHSDPRSAFWRPLSAFCPWVAVVCPLLSAFCPLFYGVRHFRS
jgi:hypothetical protein